MPNRVYRRDGGAFRRGARSFLVNMPSVGKVLSRERGKGKGERGKETGWYGGLGSVLGSPRVHFIFGGVSSETDRLYGRRLDHPSFIESDLMARLPPPSPPPLPRTRNFCLSKDS